MKASLIASLHKRFEQLVRTDEGNCEFWLGKELMEVLGYSNWENFHKVVDKAKDACRNSGYNVEDHFLDVKKMVSIGSGATREVPDIMLTRYACYIIAQNGDSRKNEIAFAQTYFALQTRRQEVIAKRLAESERLEARKKLTLSEKELSDQIASRLGKSGMTFARIRSRGDEALFGLTTKGMKEKLGVPKSKALADFLPTITIKAKDFANEITNFTIKREDLRTERSISGEHVKNNKDVRNLLAERNILPEKLPAAEDIKKIERRVKTEQKKLPEAVEPLPHDEKHQS